MDNFKLFVFFFQNISNNVVLVDVMADKVKGEIMDLQHGSLFLKNAKISGDSGNNNNHDITVILNRVIIDNY